MIQLKNHPFVVEYLDRLQAETGTREVSPALRLLLDHLAKHLSLLPPSPLQLEVSRAAAADLRVGPGQIQWRPGDAVFFDPKTGKHHLRNGTAIEVVRQGSPTELEDAIEKHTRDLIMAGVTTEAAVARHFEFKAPPGELPIAELAGPGVVEAHLPCLRCNGSGVTGPEGGTCSYCKGMGGRSVDVTALVAESAPPPELTPEQLAAAVCDHCGEKGHTFWGCPRMVHF